MSREKDQETGFLSRWSKRKLEPEQKEESQPLAGDDKAEVLPSEPETTTADEQELPIWQRDDVDAETKKEALKALFHQPEFNVRDGLNEYDNDFTQFAGLGGVVTHEMKRMLKLAEQKTRPGEPSATDSEQSQQNQQTDNSEDKEDDGIA